MSNLAKRISALSPEQRALLEQKLRRQTLNSVKAQTIPRRDPGDLCPPSFDQEQLWYMDQRHPGSNAFNLSTSYLISGPVNIDALELAFGEMMRRHEVLRTTFPTRNELPYQHVAAVGEMNLRKADLRGLPAADREAELERLVAKAAREPFDLARGPLFRALFVRLDEEVYRLCLTLHHIIMDRLSFSLLWRELMVLYDAFSKGRPSPLPELPIQFADFAVWQRNSLRGEELEAKLQYWKTQLEGATSVLELPTDRPRPAIPSFRGRRHYSVQSPELWSKLKDICQQENVTLFIALLSAFYVFLHRYTGQEDINVGSPVSNRNRVETESLIGFLLNMVVLRGNLSGDPTFRELLARVREVAMGAYDNSDLPFSKLVEELQPPRDSSRNPFFQVTFVFVDMHDSTGEQREVSMKQVDFEVGSSRFDLMLGARDRAADPTLILEYNPDLFDDATTTRMLKHFETMLEAIVSDPAQRISQLPLMTPEEESLLLSPPDERGNALLPATRTLHELFAEQAARTPEAVALVYGDEQLSFAQLDARSNQLARRLCRLGVGRGSLVALLFDRSPQMLVALLATLKAGAAYLPLDAAQPERRLSFVLADSGAALLVTHRALADRVQATTHTPVLCLDSEAASLAQESDEAVTDAGARGADLAYVIYTSGSTGAPKGVAVEHRSVSALHEALRREVYQEIKGTQGDTQLRVSLNAPLCFDGSVKQWIQLLSGHTVVIIPKEIRRDPAMLLTHLREQRVEVLDCTPSLLRLLLDEAQASGESLPRAVLCGGEAIDASLWTRLAALLPATSVFNLYGPTECTVDSALALVTADAAQPVIGRPVAHARLLVLDTAGGLLPPGAAGELYIGGAGVARGYLNRPELTAERFVPHPWSESAGARLYRTGDRVRWTAGGELEYLGRVDRQVKLRGYRIELGEVEAALRRQPGVKGCAVQLREDVPGEKRLAAYLVLESGFTPALEDWRQRLSERLPEYLLPNTFVALEVLPLTANGKVDYGALPMPEQVTLKRNEYVAPRTPVEAALVEIWSALLSKEQLGVEDNFFELGGHSLLAIQLLASIRSTFQVKPRLRSVLQEPTIAGIAAQVEQLLGERRKLLESQAQTAA